MSFRLIDGLQTKATPVAQSWRVLGVSRSGYYEAKRRAAAPVIARPCSYSRCFRGKSTELWQPSCPGRAGLSWTGAGWLYLAVVIDLVSRKVVGWAMAPSMAAKLVCDALHMAVQQRRSGERVTASSAT